MKRPTLGQVDGFVILVNTFLPALVVLTLGLMIESTLSSIHTNGCAAAAYIYGTFSQITVDKEGFPQPPVDALYRKISKEPPPVRELMKRISRERSSPEQSCSLLSAIDYLVANSLYGDTVSAVRREMIGMATNIAALGKPINVSITSLALPPIKNPKLFQKPAAEAIHGFNKHIAGPLTAVAEKGMNQVGNKARAVTYAVFQPYTNNIVKELRKANHKRRLTWIWIQWFVGKIQPFFTRFVWLFGLLGGWLLLTYVLWARRRISVAWELMANGGE